ncbi:hypothetical protein PsAD2_01023 [Pseudovibrio axinellae]|uniref:Uncharacterized protein n=1 Tax=Pseudovibrio axinellae TaxID=989403 RepID=A0A166AGA1_9HYPH|nr:hypothetical protein PsAD2_01023 [Pseudovibrio axinellae]SEP78237.1 hypothetical protein SAMN05421798_101378 [Pseudovibrio axinellae]
MGSDFFYLMLVISTFAVAAFKKEIGNPSVKSLGTFYEAFGESEVHGVQN